MKFLKLSQERGFTLVELLIVIALIAILSVAVLATINPIEQTNKARDAQFKNDAAEVLSAYERYYASNNQYPWNDATLADPVLPETPVILSSTAPGFGVVSVGDVAGSLINTSELKSSFSGKAPFTETTTTNDLLWLYSNGLDSNYVCFCPKANVNRTGSKRGDLKCLDPANNTISDQNTTCLLQTDASLATFCDPSAAAANMVCVPEGDVANAVDAEPEP